MEGLCSVTGCIELMSGGFGGGEDAGGKSGVMGGFTGKNELIRALGGFVGVVEVVDNETSRIEPISRVFW